MQVHSEAPAGCLGRATAHVSPRAQASGSRAFEWQRPKNRRTGALDCHNSHLEGAGLGTLTELAVLGSRAGHRRRRAISRQAPAVRMCAGAGGRHERSRGAGSAAGMAATRHVGGSNSAHDDVLRCGQEPCSGGLTPLPWQAPRLGRRLQAAGGSGGGGGFQWIGGDRRGRMLRTPAAHLLAAAARRRREPRQRPAWWRLCSMPQRCVRWENADQCLSEQRRCSMGL